jgi:exopolyphosphatase
MTARSTTEIPSVGTFLRHVKQSATTTNGNDASTHFILGNPAGDADSIISAICLAYIESMMMKPTTKSSLKHVPIVSIPSDNLKTQRPETSFLLKDCANIDLDDLIAVDQLATSFPELVDSNAPVSSVTLVDHNRHLYSNIDQTSSSTCNENELLMRNWAVTEIIDHHLDERSHVDTCNDDGSSDKPSRRIIAFDEQTQKATVASTCTLLVERLMEILNERKDCTPAAKLPIPPTLSILLLGVILIDSVNMIPAAGKGTPRDQAAIKFLVSKTDWSAMDPPLPQDIVVSSTSSCSNNEDGGEMYIGPDPTKLYEKLQSQKFSRSFWEGLSAMQGICLDYKTFQVESNPCSIEGSGCGHRYDSFGISTILLDMETFWKKDDLIPTLSRFLFDNNLPLLGVMFSFEKDNGAFQRQLALISHDEDIIDRLVAFLTEEGSAACNLLQLDVDTLVKESVRHETSDYDHRGISGLWFVKMDQRNTSASRKQVAPILIDFWKADKSASNQPRAGNL